MLFQNSDGWFKTLRNDCNFNSCNEETLLHQQHDKKLKVSV